MGRFDARRRGCSGVAAVILTAAAVAHADGGDADAPSRPRGTDVGSARWTAPVRSPGQSRRGHLAPPRRTVDKDRPSRPVSCVVRPHPTKPIRRCLVHPPGHAACLLPRRVGQPRSDEEKKAGDDRRLTAGWALLRSGRTARSLLAFREAMGARPREGLPAIGVALASAALHRNERAADAMRRAVRYEAKALYEVPLNARLREGIRKLLRRYRAGRRLSPADASFLVAALSVVLGNHEKAHAAVERAHDAAPKPTTATLRRVIADQLDAGETE